ncbi:MAG: glycosyltransferase family 4 protein [Gaiellaceae bacterium]
MKVALLSSSAEENGLGRAFALWLIAKHLGWEVRIVAPATNRPWAPLAREERFLGDLRTDAPAAAAWCDLIVALKPWPGSLDLAIALGRAQRRPVALDVDDPDWENIFGERRRRQIQTFLQRSARGRPPLRAYRLRWAASRLPAVLISNPALQRWYRNAAVIPHARPPRPPQPPRAHSEEIEIAFIGSVRPHKGVEVLRRAVERAGGMRLTITGVAPPDARPHENWTGETSLAEGLELLDRADVVAIPSHDWTYSRGQLPVKLIDAMMAGKAVVGSDLAPVRWALAGTGLLVPPADVEALAAALDSLRAPAIRADLGARARERALATFTPAAIAPALAAALAFCP